MNPLKEWIGKSIRESNIAAKHKITILGVKKQGDEGMSMLPSADYVINENEHLMIMAENEVVEKGQTIATVGETASFEVADEPHLHFEIRVNGSSINPQSYIGY